VSLSMSAESGEPTGYDTEVSGGLCETGQLRGREGERVQWRLGRYRGNR
jgi:hypothetical protein